MKYVVGFLFNSKLDEVALILKKHGPEFMRGKLNGVGGKCEDGESYGEAMLRELEEEFTLETSQSVTTILHVGTYRHSWRDTQNCIGIFALRSSEENLLKVLPDINDVGELVVVIPQSLRPHLKDIVPNVKWLVPLCRFVLTQPKTTRFEAQFIEQE